MGASEPVGLPAKAVAGEVREPRAPIDVYAWVPYRDGYYHPVKAQATGWTDRAVRIRWKLSQYGTEQDGTEYELWVWAKAVTRRQGWIMQGPPATERPELIAYRGPR